MFKQTQSAMQMNVYLDALLCESKKTTSIVRRRKYLIGFIRARDKNKSKEQFENRNSSIDFRQYKWHAYLREKIIKEHSACCDEFAFIEVLLVCVNCIRCCVFILITFNIKSQLMVGGW